MASSMLFMQLTLKGKPIKGDSKIKGYEEQIELTSMSWGLSIDDKTAAKGATQTIKNWDAKALEISKYMDGASTALYGHVDEREGLRTSGRSEISKRKSENKAVISMVAVSAVADGKEMPVIMRMTLAGCRIIDISLRAGDGRSALALAEDLTLAYQDLQIDYHPATDKHTRAAATQFSLQQKSS